MSSRQDDVDIPEHDRFDEVRQVLVRGAIHELDGNVEALRRMADDVRGYVVKRPVRPVGTDENAQRPVAGQGFQEMFDGGVKSH